MRIEELKKDKKPGRPHTKKRRKTVGISMERADYEDVVLYRDYRDLSMSEIFNKLWADKKKSLEDGGSWPPEILDDGDRDFEQSLGRKTLNRNLIDE